MRRCSWMAVCITVAAVSAAANAQQQVPNRADAVEVRKQFVTDLDTLYTKFYALANAIPAEKYSWRPAPGVRSIGEVFMHVASEFYVWTPLSYGAPLSPVIGSQSESAMKRFEAVATTPLSRRHLAWPATCTSTWASSSPTPA